MEVDCASDDSDATVAGDEEDLPAATSKPATASALAAGSGQGSGNTSQPINIMSAVTVAAAAQQPTSRASDVDSEADPVSPSLLHGCATSRSRLESQAGRNSDMEVVPNSSGEGSTCDDEEMSQEFPPITAPVTAASKVTANKADVRNSLHLEEPRIRSLSSVLEEQQSLSTYLNTLMGSPSDKQSSLITDARKKALLLEDWLKETNLNNQTERKKLAAAHKDLITQCNSQDELSQGTQPLKEQLLQLAIKQKQLLECFKKQKEINATLSKLEETVKAMPEQTSTVTNKADVMDGRRSACEGTKLGRNYSMLMATIPNLVQHLRHPVVQAQVQQGAKEQPQSLRLNQNSHPVQVTGYSSQASQVAGQSVATTTQPIVSLSQVTSSASAQQIARIPATSSSQVQPCSHQQQRQPSQLPPSVPQAQQASTNTSTSNNNSSSSRPVTSTTTTVAASAQQFHKEAVGGGDCNTNAVKVTPLSSDLAQPVPLVDLISHGFIKPGDGCLSCKVMGCEFKASLMKDGSIKDHLGTHHQMPQQWFKSCWAKLGHTQKKPNKKSAYTSVHYEGVPLLQLCEKYSLKQVNSYLSGNDKQTTSANLPPHQSTHMAQSSSTNLAMDTSGLVLHTCASSDQPVGVNVTASVSWGEVEIDQLLKNGRLLLHSSSLEQTSLKLPSSFWRDGENVVLSEHLRHCIEQDLQW